MMTNDQVITTIALEAYWKTFETNIEKLSEQLEKEGKVDKEGKIDPTFNLLKKQALELASIGGSIKKMDTSFRQKHGKLINLELLHFIPGHSLKITSYPVLLLGEIYYEHLCSFSKVHSNDIELDVWLQKEKSKSRAVHKALTLKQLLTEYRKVNQLETKNYDQSVKVEAHSHSEQEDELEKESKLNLDDDGFDFLDTSARRAPGIEKQIDTILSRLEWPSGLLNVLNDFCKESFDLDVSRFQLIKRAGTEESYIPSLSFEALKIIHELSAIKDQYWQEKDKTNLLKGKMIDFKEDLTYKKETLLNTKSSKIEQKIKLEQEKRIRAQKLGSMTTPGSMGSPNTTGTPFSPGNSQSTSPNANLVNTNLNQNVNQSVNSQSVTVPSKPGLNSANQSLTSIPVTKSPLPVTDSKTNPISGSKAVSGSNAVLSNTVVSNTVVAAPIPLLIEPNSPVLVSSQALLEEQREYQLFLANTRELERTLNIQPVNEALEKWPERVHKEYTQFLLNEKNNAEFLEISKVFSDFKNDLALDLKCVNEKDASISLKIKLLSYISDLYWQVISHDQLNYSLKQNPRDKAKCNQYCDVLLNLEEILKNINKIIPSPKTNAIFAALAKNIREEFESISILLIEYHKLNEDSPFRTPYKPKFKMDSDSICFLWNISPTKEQGKTKRPKTIPDQFFKIESTIEGLQVLSPSNLSQNVSQSSATNGASSPLRIIVPEDLPQQQKTTSNVSQPLVSQFNASQTKSKETPGSDKEANKSSDSMVGSLFSTVTGLFSPSKTTVSKR